MAFMHRLAVLSAALLLAGCATGAQRQYQAISAGNQQIATDGMACMLRVYNDPRAAPLRAHSPLKVTDASLAQLSDASFATPTEVAAILALHPPYKECQNEVVSGISRTVPSAAIILAKAFAENDDDTIALTQRKISWGEATTRRRNRALAMQAAVAGEGQRVTSELQQQHDAELARRQQAADGLINAAAAISAAGQASRLPAAAYTLPNNTTNCTYGGGYMQCH